MVSTQPATPKAGLGDAARREESPDEIPHPGRREDSLSARQFSSASWLSTGDRCVPWAWDRIRTDPATAERGIVLLPFGVRRMSMLFGLPDGAAEKECQHCRYT